MTEYESVRDNPRFMRRLDAEQLFKHAFALRTEADRLRTQGRRRHPILFYLYTEPAR
ncbi:MAG: hypothetical protein OXD42_06800 [Rhodospirillaceae bacterium]|nr:hypothetical protein [Rhodospirillaceae bacterium]